MKFAIGKVLGWIVVVYMVLAALGLYNGGLTTLRWMFFVGNLLFAFIAFQGKKRFWLITFLTFAIIFNPLAQFHLGLANWRLIDLIAAVFLGFFLWHYYDYYGKGYKFEKYVSTLFPANQWTIVDKTRDYSKSFKRKVESDSNPDFTFRHIASGKVVAVECKFRSYIYKGGIQWGARNEQNYAAYGKKNNIPVYIILGVGNSPTHPREMFVVPVDKLKNVAPGFIFESDLNQYRRDSQKPFFYSEPNGLV